MNDTTRHSAINYDRVGLILTWAAVLGIFSFALVAETARFQVIREHHEGGFPSRYWSSGFDIDGWDYRIRGLPLLPTLRVYSNGCAPRLQGSSAVGTASSRALRAGPLSPALGGPSRRLT